MKIPSPLPLKNGIKASRLVLPHQPSLNGSPLLDFLCQRFPFVHEHAWRTRLNSGYVVDQNGQTLDEKAIFLSGSVIFYYRDLIANTETRIPFTERILFVDEHLIVVDKPHFLPVIPSGRFLQETLLTRLRQRPELQHLRTDNFTPLHRLDKDTAGVILFSHCAKTRGAYQKLFQNKMIQKIYHAIAPIRPELTFPLTVQSRLIRGKDFFLTQTVNGSPNAQTHITLLAQHGDFGLYELRPITGKKHQLRVHMMNLGLPLVNDALYPEALPLGTEDFAKPLKLLAKSIQFPDPISGEWRTFSSQQHLWEHD